MNKIKTSEPKVLWNLKCTLGEGTLWVKEHNSIYFVDIKKKRIHMLNIKNRISIVARYYSNRYHKLSAGYIIDNEHYDDYYMYDYEEQINGPAFVVPEINRSILMSISIFCFPIFVVAEIEALLTDHTNLNCHCLKPLSKKVNHLESFSGDLMSRSTSAHTTELLVMFLLFVPCFLLTI